MPAFDPTKIGAGTPRRWGLGVSGVVVIKGGAAARKWGDYYVFEPCERYA